MNTSETRKVDHLSQLTKNIMEGAALRAFRKISRTARSDSPTYLLMSLNDIQLLMQYPLKMV